MPKDKKIEERTICAEFLTEPVSEGRIEFDDVRWEGNPDQTAMDDGHPPVINVGDHSNILLKLIHSEENTNLIIGYQLLVQAAEGQWSVAANNRLFHPAKLRSVKRSDIKVWCRQIVGVPSIDGKQVSILKGKCSCSVLCPMCRLYGCPR